MVLANQSKGNGRMGADNVSACTYPCYEDTCPVFDGGLLHDVDGLCEGFINLKCVLNLYFQHARGFQN